MSINWRELKAAFLALQSFPHLHHKTILLRTDNTTSLSHINKFGGSRVPALNTLATELWTWCLQRGITIQAQHIPGRENVVADQESRRTFTKNHWQIHPRQFHILQQRLGRHCVDLFADRTTSLLPKYVSWKPDPGAIAVDAFSLNWSQFRRPWANPPWNLITRTLHKILQDRVTLITMVVPHWTSALWYPLLQRLAISKPLLLSASHIRCCSPLTPFPLKNDWKLSVWQLSGQSL